MPSDRLPEPWRSFLQELDTLLAGPTELHCFGGFVVAQCYGLMRPTADIDILESKGTDLLTIAKLAGRTSPLHKRHGVYIDVVTVADVPDNYDERLTTPSMHHLRNCSSASSNGTIWCSPRSSGTTIETAPMSRQLREGQGSISTCFARDISRSSGQSLAGRNAKTSPLSSGSRSSKNRGSAGRDEDPLASKPLVCRRRADTERLVREIPPAHCLESSGDTVAIGLLILHTSSKAETDHPRRVLHIEYVDSLESTRDDESRRHVCEKGGVFRPSRNCQIAPLERDAVKVSHTPTPQSLAGRR